MEIIVTILAYVGGLAIALGITSLASNLHDLFRRVDTLEANDRVRRDDIIEIKKQISRMIENNK